MWSYQVVLRNLTFGRNFDQSLDNVILPENLENLTFGEDFDQSLEHVTLPGNLQSLTFGQRFNQSLDGVTLPSSLVNLTFGYSFNRSLENVKLPEDLQRLTFGGHFNESLMNVALPRNLQCLTLSRDSIDCLDGVTLPRTLQNLRLGWRLISCAWFPLHDLFFCAGFVQKQPGQLCHGPKRDWRLAAAQRRLSKQSGARWMALWMFLTCFPYFDWSKGVMIHVFSWFFSHFQCTDVTSYPGLWAVDQLTLLICCSGRIPMHLNQWDR